MKLLSYIPSFLLNKYLLAAAFFIIWLLFFDRNDLLMQTERRKELQNLRESKRYFIQQIAEERKFSDELKTNPAAIEKYAREKYGMKRDGEEVFIIMPARENK